MDELDKIEDFFRKNGSSLKAKGGDAWRTFYPLMQDVKDNDLWRMSSGCRCFTAWIKAMAFDLEVSSSWLWRIYSGGATLARIDERKTGSVRRFDEITESYPDLSLYTLLAIISIREAKLSEEFSRQVEDEAISGQISSQELQALAREVIRCRNAGVRNIEERAVLNKIDFGKHFGQEGQKKWILSDHQSKPPLDALVFLPQSDGEAVYIGLQFANQAPGAFKFPDGLHRRFIVTTGGNYLSADSIPAGVGVIKLNPVSGVLDIERNDSTESPKHSKYHSMSHSIVTRLALGSASQVSAM